MQIVIDLTGTDVDLSETVQSVHQVYFTITGQAIGASQKYTLQGFLLVFLKKGGGTEQVFQFGNVK